VFIAYPQHGFSKKSFHTIGAALLTQLHQADIQQVSLVNHSAGGVISDRILRSLGSSSEHPWQAWHRQGVDIGSAHYFSSPTEAGNIKRATQQTVEGGTGQKPRALLRTGIVGKFLGNNANRVVDGSFARQPVASVISAFQNTGTNYSPTSWLQQLRTLEEARHETWPDLYAPGTRLGVVIPECPEADTVVHTDTLAADWERKLSLEPGTILTHRSPDIQHANISEMPQQCAQAILATLLA
jgi:hypothetical protein